MWVKTTVGAMNLDTCLYAELGNTAGEAIFHFPTGVNVTAQIVVFGSTTADATAGIAKVTQALDPTIYA